jgi:hypothetical protein
MVKLTVNLTEEDVQAIEALAKKKGITRTDAIRQAITDEKFFADAEDEGYTIVLAPSFWSRQWWKWILHNIMGINQWQRVVLR